MANSVTASVSSSITFTQQDTQTDASFVEQTTASTSYSFTAGTGAGEVNAAFQENSTVPSGGTKTIDVTNLQRHVFGAQQTVDFHLGNIKAITIANTSDNAIRVMATGSQGFIALFNGTGGFPVPPYSAYTYVNTVGLSVSGNPGSYIQLLNLGGSGTTYELGVVGVTGLV